MKQALFESWFRNPPKEQKLRAKVSEKTSIQVGMVQKPGRDENMQEDYPNLEQWQKKKQKIIRYICYMSFFSSMIPRKSSHIACFYPCLVSVLLQVHPYLK